MTCRVTTHRNAERSFDALGERVGSFGAKRRLDHDARLAFAVVDGNVQSRNLEARSIAGDRYTAHSGSVLRAHRRRRCACRCRVAPRMSADRPGILPATAPNLRRGDVSHALARTHASSSPCSLCGKLYGRRCGGARLPRIRRHVRDRRHAPVAGKQIAPRRRRA